MALVSLVQVDVIQTKEERAFVISEKFSYYLVLMVQAFPQVVFTVKDIKENISVGITLNPSNANIYIYIYTYK